MAEKKPTVSRKITRQFSAKNVVKPANLLKAESFREENSEYRKIIFMENIRSRTKKLNILNNNKADRENREFNRKKPADSSRSQIFLF